LWKFLAFITCSWIQTFQTIVLNVNTHDVIFQIASRGHWQLAKHKEQNEPVKGYSPKDIESRIVKSFLDILILVDLKKQNSLSGYDVIEFVNSRFGGTISPGTVYATLYALERKGIIKGGADGRKTVFSLTTKGTVTVDSMMSTFNEEMGLFVKKFLTL
jgi:DNA-binding PadR family transcriptional regulator